MGLFELPEILQLRLTELLLGIDLFQLSHASRCALQLFSEDRFWAPRLPPSTGPRDDAKPRHWLRFWANSPRLQTVSPSGKRDYMHHYSSKFNGSTFEGQPRYGLKWPISKGFRGPSYVNMNWQGHDGAISYDMWFSLAPDEPGCIRGGILLGGQLDALRVTGHRSHNYRQAVFVDTQGNLYCSILNAYKNPIATNLQSERWYHLVLTWENDVERVYLDNELVSEEKGFLHFEWRRQSYWQIGGGGISGDSVGKPTEDWDGWLGFRGIIDDFRIWTRPLTSEQIQQLGRQVDLGDSWEPVFAMKQYRARHQRVERVNCSRPLERICHEFDS